MGKIKPILNHLILVTFLISCLLLISCNFDNTKVAKKGYLEIPEVFVENHKKISLNGEWEFYWNEIYGDALFQKIAEKKQTYVNVPSSWNSVRPEGIGGDGYASFRLVVKVPDPNIRYYLRVQPATSAYELYINRQKIAYSGVIGVDQLSAKPKYQIQYVSFQPESYEQEIIYVVSNFHHARGGYRKPIEMGTKEVIQNESLIYSAGEVFVFGAMLTMALYQLTVFFFRRQEKSSLFFALFCLFTGLRLVILDNYYIVYAFPDFSWKWMQVLDYSSAPLLVCFFLSYLRSLFPGKSEVPNWMLQSCWSLSFTYVLFVLLTDPKLFTTTNIVSQVFILFFSICSFYVIFRIYRQRKRDSSLVFYGSLILMLGSTHDLMAGNYWFQAQPLMPFSLFVFFLFQSILLARRNARFYSSMDTLTTELIEVNNRLESSNKVYAKFVPLRLIQLFSKKDESKVKRGDFIVKHMSVLSSDIRDFTAISETLSPEETFLFLNDYLRQVGPIIRSQNGFIEKYVGDAIFALFEKEPEDALSAAIQMHKTIAKWNKESHNHRVGEIQIGVGIHFGELMLGIVGEEQRIESAVLSDSMGVANSLESMTKKYGAKIILSLDALLELKEPDSYPHRLLDFIKIPAKQKLIGIAQVLVEGVEESFQLKIQTKEEFEESVNLFWDGDFRAAELGFSSVLNRDPSDKAALLYLERSQQYLQNGPPPGFGKGFLA
ncbi:adenylate/guanylate cyclase domain-containing protein [Leptospira biflexa]|uniref:adenylate/guanylate cyclase domain-containing protein n=1 Tax=Leptospira biflexa TaxID=172 RepID=UPI0010916AC8|nr:adenylate/guanylate cyclase domain-containing protein [Leptospira biflexa]TGM46550.1 adenylate/guanylate cyclase domain-containing protein [Leptospira biflexa]TGM50987.1 adenylate/guanylate cyclase domain-containing protein [Leptospira biflexa]